MAKLAIVVPVGQLAAPEREQQDGQELQRGDDAERTGRVAGQIQDQPVLGGEHHPHADQLDQLPGDEQPVVADLQGPECLTQHCPHSAAPLHQSYAALARGGAATKRCRRVTSDR
jgi:hypothetical protein